MAAPALVPLGSGVAQRITITGEFGVEIDPEEAREGTTWSIDGSRWLRPEEVCHDVPAGRYEIELRTPPGWRQPPRRLVVAHPYPGGRKFPVAVRKTPTFPLGTIRDRLFRPGERVEFGVAADGLSGRVRYGVTAEPPIHGSLGFLGETRYFCLTPDAKDTTAFSVILTATDDSGQSVTQRVGFEPAADYAPEAVVFHPSAGSAPQVTSKDFFIYTEEEGPQGSMNHLTVTPRHIEVAAPLIEIADVEGNPFRNLNGNTNIKSLKLAADTVVVRMPLRLHGTDVEIWARELRFEDPESGGTPACIDTTPLSSDDKAPPGERGTDGMPGLNGGAIKLHIQSLVDSHAGRVRLISDGSNGQPAGNGANGKDGNDVPGIISDRARFDDVQDRISSNTGTPIPYADDLCYVRYEQHNALFIIPLPDLTIGSPEAAPTNGGPAVAPGTPGRGGDGGAIRANLDVAAVARGRKGEPGTPAPATKGGRAGVVTPPNSKRWRRIQSLADWRYPFGGSQPWRDIASGETVDGKGAESRVGAVGKEGGFLLGERSAYSWLHPRALRLIVLFFRECFLTGRIDAELLSLMRYYRMALDHYAEEGHYGTITPLFRADLSRAREALRLMVERYDQGLDYFGNPPGWAPLLSFEFTASSFNDQVDSAIKLLYLNYWIGDLNKSNEQRRQAMEESRRRKRAELGSLQAAYANARLQYEKNSGLAKKNAVKLKQTVEALRDLDEKLQRQAGENVNPAWKQVVSAACKGAATIAYFIPHPVAQGAGIALETGGDILENANPANLDWGQIVGAAAGGGADILSLYGDTLKADLEANQQAVGEEAARVAELPDQNARIDRINTISLGLRKTSTTITSVLDSFRRSSVPSPQVKAELEKLKLHDPEFIRLKKRVENLSRERGVLAASIRHNLLRMEETSGEIVECLLLLDALSESIQKAEFASLSSRTATALQGMARGAEDRLLRYRYYMGKSYEYRFLKPNDWSGINLEPLRRECIRLVETSRGAPLSGDEFERLKGLYKQDIAKVADEINTHYAEGSISGLRDSSQIINLPPNLIEEINRLGEGEAVAVNLFELGVFNPEEDRLRIKFTFTEGSASRHDYAGIAPAPAGEGGEAEMSMRLEGPDAGRDLSVCDVSFVVTHSGRSRLWGGVDSFDFNNGGNVSSEMPIKWIFKYNHLLPKGRRVSVSRPSNQTRSLLSTLLRTEKNSELFSYPAVDGMLYFQKEATNSGDRDVRLMLESLKLKIDYEFAPLNPNPNVADKKVLEVATRGDISPVYALSDADASGRRNGMGFLHRVFDSRSVERLTITAPERFGSARFIKWSFKGGEQRSTAITVQPATFSNSHRIIAVYSVYRISGRVTLDRMPTSGGAVRLALTGGDIADESPFITFVDASGEYCFTGLAPGVGYTLTPSLEGHVFDPPSVPVTITDEEVVNRHGVDIAFSVSSA